MLMRTTDARDVTAPSARTVASIVGGRTLEDAPGGSFGSVNPARTDETVAEVLLGDAGTFVAASRAAREAQKEWAAVPAPIRSRVIQKLGRIVENNKGALARLITREIGKPYSESLGEVQEIMDTCDFFTGEGRRLYGQTVPSEMPDKQLFTFRNPVGVALAKLFIAGGLPDGVLNVVQAEGPAAFGGLERALDEGLVDKVGFTGSSEVGKKIGELCGRHMQSPCLELGGKNPLVVMPDADLDLAVEGALFSGFGTAGQRCTSLGTVIVHQSVHDEFLSR